jgi:hypothetical protein
MPQCVTCGCELHPERAQKYNYCMARECQEKNAKGLTMVAVGVNKSAEQYLILDERTREELASGKYHDQRRGSFGPPARSARSPAAATGAATEATAATAANTAKPATASTPKPATASTAASTAGAARQQAPPSGRRAGRSVPRRPWSKSQEKLALLYNEQRLRPDEIARKLGISTYLVTQIILDARNRGKR